MRARKLNDQTPQRASIYLKAYRYQFGDYYPQHHVANLAKLAELYPDRGEREIEAIYLQACRINDTLKDWGGGLVLTEASREELFSWFEAEFPEFPEDCFDEAIKELEIEHDMQVRPSALAPNPPASPSIQAPSGRRKWLSRWKLKS